MMKRILTLSLICFLMIVSVKAASLNIDSLERAVDNMPVKSRIMALNQLSQHYLSKDVTKSINFAIDALALSRSLNEPDQTALSYLNIGNGFYNFKDYRSSLLYFDSSLNEAKKANNSKAVSAALTNIGAAWEGQGKYQKSLEYFLEALKINITINDSVGIGKSYNNIGNIYYYMNIPKSALDHYQKSLDIFKKLHNTPLTNALVNNVGMIYSVMGKPEQALASFKEYLAHCEKNKDQEGRAMALNNIGSLYYDSQMYQDALSYFLQSYKISEALGITGPNTLYYIGSAYKKMGNLSEALTFFTKAVHLARANNLLDELRSSYEAIHQTYAKTGNYKEAYEYALLYQSVNDSLNKEMYSKQMLEIQTKYETQKKEQEIEVLKAKANSQSLELKRQKLMTTIFVIGFILLAAIIGLVIYSLQLKIKSNSLLQVQKDIAEKANRAKSVFLSNMSHEIRTPMNGIVGMAEVLRTSRLSEQQQQYTDVIISSSNKLLTVINNVLDYTLIESGKINLERKVFDLHRLFDEVAEQYRQKAEENQLSLASYYSEEIPERVYGDAMRMRQVLMNIADNAVRFTEKGEVMMTAELREKTESAVKIVFTIKDTGIGMTREEQAKAFLPFSQVDSSMTRRYTGAGLGLAISQRLVEEMGGKISLESTVNEGSVFSFLLSFETENDQHSSLIINIDLAGKKVLIVDESPNSRMIYRKYLEHWKGVVEEAGSPVEALHYLKMLQASSRQFDLIMVDHHLHNPNGLEFGREVRSYPSFAEINMILVSSRPDTLSEKEAQKAGFQCFLAKPVQINELSDVLCDLFPGAKVQKMPGDLKTGLPDDSPTSPLKILLVEDNEVNQQVILLLFKRYKTVVDIATGGTQAIEMIQQGDYDLVLMDVQMPDMDGIEATINLRRWEGQLGRQKRLKIFALTADATRENRDKCLEAGMDGYFEKPFSVEELLKVVRLEAVDS